MQHIKINFFGTNNFAKTILQGLIHSPNFEIAKIVTMPDRPQGRKKEIQASVVKKLGLKNNILVTQPEKLNDVEYASDILNIVVDYGMIIPKEIINKPKYGSINIHPSLLPKYRGASPIQSVILNGEKKTGVTIMLMDEKMDHGPILAQQEVEISRDDKTPDLNQKTADRASELLLNIVPGYISGQIKPQEQEHKQATTCQLIKREDGLINFKHSADQIYNQYRAFFPWPGIYTTYDGKKIKFLDIEVVDKQLEQGVMKFEKNIIYVGCKQGTIKVNEIQLEGKQAMSANVFVNGHDSLNNVKLK